MTLTTMKRQPRTGRHTTVYDLVGVGFGPSNLALATTIDEELPDSLAGDFGCLFLERKESFAWHPGMLLGGAKIQLSFLKDLATLRNPQSSFTFLKYLQEKGRLDKFINLRSFYPSRLEFCDYYSWAAERVAENVRYSRQVTSIRPVIEDGSDRVEWIEVEHRDLDGGNAEVALARNVVLAVGGKARVPGDIDLRASRRAFHSDDFLARLEQGFPDRSAPYRFVVVGSGQTAAEIFQYLFDHYPKADITAAVRRFAYKPADDSHFVNEIFFPDKVDMLFSMPEEKRRMVLEAHMDTNYSAVDLDLIQEIYEVLYEEMVAGNDRARVRPFIELRGLVDHEDRTVLQFRNLLDDEPEVLEADGVVLATGFDRRQTHPLLSALEPYLLPEGDGYQVSRHYRVGTRPEFHPGIFLQGFCEDTHGLSDTLLSTLPMRSMEILEEVLGAAREEWQVASVNHHAG